MARFKNLPTEYTEFIHQVIEATRAIRDITGGTNAFTQEKEHSVTPGEYRNRYTKLQNIGSESEQQLLSLEQHVNLEQHADLETEFDALAVEPAEDFKGEAVEPDFNKFTQEFDDFKAVELDKLAEQAGQVAVEYFKPDFWDCLPRTGEQVEYFIGENGPWQNQVLGIDLSCDCKPSLLLHRWVAFTEADIKSGYSNFKIVGKK